MNGGVGDLGEQIRGPVTVHRHWPYGFFSRIPDPGSRRSQSYVDAFWFAASTALRLSTMRAISWRSFRNSSTR